MSIGGNIYRIRTLRKLTQQQVAEQAGVSRAMIAQLERETKVLSLPLAKRLCEVLECGFEDLVDTAVSLENSDVIRRA